MCYYGAMSSVLFICQQETKKGDEITMFMIGFVHFVSYMDLNPF